jgi:hypothetical protein
MQRAKFFSNFGKLNRDTAFTLKVLCSKHFIPLHTKKKALLVKFHKTLSLIFLKKKLAIFALALAYFKQI